MIRVAVLGSEGMLGHVMARFLGEQRGLDVFGFNRTNFDIDDLGFIHDFEYVVNCIGVIKPRIVESDVESVKEAYRVNSWFPRQLADASMLFDTRILQIATDCVYSGDGISAYDESSPHDAEDVYGRSKSLGEVKAPSIRHIRCSIIGPEKGTQRSLLEWVRSKRGSGVNGYMNHLWNGVTTLAFSRVITSIILNNSWSGLPDFPLHLVPEDICSKADLVGFIAEAYGLDVHVAPVETDVGVNRCLSTNLAATNECLWLDAGYKHPPSIRNMVREISSWT